MTRRPSGRAAALAVAATGLCLAVAAVALALPGRAGPTASAAAAAADPPGSVAALRAEVARVPGNWPAWAALGGLELEQGRATGDPASYAAAERSEEHTSELQSHVNLVCRLLLEKK